MQQIARYVGSGYVLRYCVGLPIDARTSSYYIAPVASNAYASPSEMRLVFQILFDEESIVFVGALVVEIHMITSTRCFDSECVYVSKLF